MFSGEGDTWAAEAVQTWWRGSAHFLNTERFTLMTWTEGRTPGSQVCSQKAGSGRWQTSLPGEAALRPKPPPRLLVTLVIVTHPSVPHLSPGAPGKQPQPSSSVLTVPHTQPALGTRV